MLMKMFLTFVIVLAFLVLNQLHQAEAANGLRFEITGSGSLFHFEPVVVIPGTKPPVTKVSAAQIASCIMGTPSPCDTNVENNGTGKAYLYIPNSGDGSKIYVSTDDNCGSLTELDGVVGGNGQFMYAGEHDLSDARIIIQGTVTFDKNQFPNFVPLGIKKASIMAVSDTFNHYGIGSFATVPLTSTAVSCLP